MRDKIKNKLYFDKYIERQMKRVLIYSADVNDGQIKEDRIQAVKSLINNIDVNIMIAKYSRGDDIDEIGEIYEDVFPKWLEVFEPDYYNKNIKMLSIGICLGVSKNSIMKVYEMLCTSRKEDWLYEFLVKSYIGEEVDNDIELLFKKQYGKLKKIIIESDGIMGIKNYLSKNWYNANVENYNAHNFSNNNYYGYWSFEVGAIVKLLGLDDTILKDMKYYPYDLVHYKEERDGIIQ